MRDLNEQLASVWQKEMPTPSQILQRKSLTFQVVARLFEQAQIIPDKTEQLEKHQELLPILQYIDAHLADPLPRQELAKLVNISPSRFAYIFKAMLGIAPGEYIQQQRLTRAQQLLQSTSLSVREIASQVGYPDAFHFSRLFKRSYGYSPAYWREHGLLH